MTRVNPTDEDTAPLRDRRGRVRQGPDKRHHGPFFRRFLHLAMPYWASAEKWKIGISTFALVVLTVAQVCIPVALNIWNERLFNALEQRAMDRFIVLVGALLVIIAVNVTVVTLHLRVKRGLQIDWRRWLTQRLFSNWMNNGRQFLVTFLPGEHDNPDGRIAEDIRISVEYAIDLAHSLFYCVLLLVSFTQILWTLSGPPLVRMGSVTFYLPGHLVWVAVIYAAVGTWVAWALGLPLVRAVDRRQTSEANFRFGLVHARENAMSIALLSGEVGERRSFRRLLRALIHAWDRQTSALSNIMLFTSSWSVLSQAFPFLVAAPRYIGGAITLGVLMQTAQAFQQMINALSWPVDNLAKVAEWRASVERVLGLHEALKLLDRRVAEGTLSGISYDDAVEPALIFRDVEVLDPTGAKHIDTFSARIDAGDKILIGGDPAAAVKLFKVVAGLWPWGAGRVEFPAENIFFMPHRPYLPIGSLREAIVFPQVKQVDDDELKAVLERVGLGHLSSRLNDTETWEHVLAVGEQQRLGFARLLLHRPSWIFIQEATDGLDKAGEAEMMALIDAELPLASVITIGHHSSLEAFHRRRIWLNRVNGYAVVEERTLAASVVTSPSAEDHGD